METPATFAKIINAIETIDELEILTVDYGSLRAKSFSLVHETMTEEEVSSLVNLLTRGNKYFKVRYGSFFLWVGRYLFVVSWLMR